LEILFEYRFSKRPLLSIVLLDWSIRESCHILNYLNNQEVGRELYEIIWIEYYNRHQSEIEPAIKKNSIRGLTPPLNKWVVMNMSKDIYYHKHLMYNIGIVLSAGNIITFCDSDACLKPTFIKSIIDSFNQDKNIVLHMDEVRNNNRRFYPFSDPSFDEITGPGCINWTDGKPRGLVDLSDPIHIRNYGACMAALRKDLIAIGGADEDMDYLGHICGPYEMTFRLTNFGKKEIWHQNEWLYHLWHPGQAGRWNYVGPHDGKHMSTTALEIIQSGRIMPLTENPAISALRLGRIGEIFYTSLLSQVIPEDKILKKWKVNRTPLTVIKYCLANTFMTIRDWAAYKTQNRPFFRRICILILRPKYTTKKLISLFRLFTVLPGMIIKQFYIKASVPSKGRLRFVKKPGRLFERFSSIYLLLIKLWKYNKHLIRLCWQCIERLCEVGIREVVVFGSGDIARILYILSQPVALKIEAFSDDNKRKTFLGFRLISPEKLNGSKEKIIIASIVNVKERIKRLKEVGIDEERIVTL